MLWRNFRYHSILFQIFVCLKSKFERLYLKNINTVIFGGISGWFCNSRMASYIFPIFSNEFVTYVMGESILNTKKQQAQINSWCSYSSIAPGA
jgi:hypothetical protein